jgi:hypothetical protein
MTGKRTPGERENQHGEARQDVIDGREWLVSPAGMIAVDRVDRLVTLFARSLRHASTR